jgi:hypothetical protein
MKTIFKINFIAQMVILGIAITALILSQPLLAFIVFFFGCGAWQLITSLIIWGNPEGRNKIRSRYLLFLGFIFMYSLIFYLPIILKLNFFGLENFVFYYLFSMIPIGIVMAVFNAYISFHEMKSVEQNQETQFLNL